MVRLTLSAPLATLLPEVSHVRSSRATVQVEASCWFELTEQLRERYPSLASRVLAGHVDVKPGFVVAVNDQVTSRPEPTFELMPGDEVYIFAAVAGGCAYPPREPSEGASTG
jgi:molybdopterin converting factor small subunit